MMRRRFTLKVLLAIGLALGGTGCFTEISQLPGHYQGNLTQGKSTRIVSADISFAGGSGVHGAIQIKDSQDRDMMTIQIPVVHSSDSFDLLIPAVTSQAVTVSLTGSCFSGAAANLLLKLCYDDNEILLNAVKGSGVTARTLFALTLDRFDQEAPLRMENARDFTLSQAVTQALDRNYSERIQVQQTAQAVGLAKAAYLNLIPHLNINSLIPIAVGDMAGTLTSFESLAPFLLPSRWIQAAEASWQAKAQQDALTLIRIDTALQVEGLSYTYAHDAAVSDLLTQMYDAAYKVRNQIKVREDAGQLAPGSTDNMDATVESIQENMNTLSLNVAEDKTAIAQALGLNNPDGVKSITLDPETVSAASATPLDEKEIASIALSRSFELRQLSYLLHAAQDQKKELYWDWLDPMGNPQTEFGVSLISNEGAAAAQVKQIELQIEQMQQTIVTNVYDMVKEYNNEITFYRLAEQTLATQVRILNRLTDQVQSGLNFDMVALVNAFQNDEGAVVSIQDVTAAFRLSRAKLDRYLLQGYYSGPAASFDGDHLQ